MTTIEVSFDKGDYELLRFILTEIHAKKCNITEPHCGMCRLAIRLDANYSQTKIIIRD